MNERTRPAKLVNPPPKDWNRTIGMFRGDPIMKEVIDEALRRREEERAAAREQAQVVQP